MKPIGDIARDFDRMLRDERFNGNVDDAVIDLLVDYEADLVTAICQWLRDESAKAKKGGTFVGRSEVVLMEMLAEAISRGDYKKS